MEHKIDMTKVTTLIFDLGGVIIDLDRMACVRAYERLGLDEAGELLDQYEPRGVFLQMERGEVTPDAFRDAIRRMTGQPLTDEQIDAAHDEFLVAIPEHRKATLRALRKKYRVLALSNTSPIHIEGYFKPALTYDGFTVEDHFDKMYLSYEVGATKPGMQIFETLLAEEGVNPDECLFLDDGIRNIEMARSLGFQVMHVTDTEWEISSTN